MKFNEVFGEDVKNMSMWQLAHNCYFVKEVDGKREAWYRDYEKEISCRELVRQIIVKNDLQEEVPEEIMTDDEEFDETMHEFLQYDTDYMMCVIAMFYQAMWAFAETREAAIKPNLLER